MPYERDKLALHHEDDVRVERRVEEVDQRLGAELSCTCIGGVPGALLKNIHLHTHNTSRHMYTQMRERGREGWGGKTSEKSTTVGVFTSMIAKLFFYLTSPVAYK